MQQHLLARVGIVGKESRNKGIVYLLLFVPVFLVTQKQYQILVL